MLIHLQEQSARQSPMLNLLQASERNLRRALLMLETCRVMQLPLTADQPLQLPDWELYVQVTQRSLAIRCGTQRKDKGC